MDVVLKFTQRPRGVDTVKVEILGVMFDSISLPLAVERGAALAGDGFHYVVTPNPEVVSLARADSEYRDILNGADLVLPDGIGIVYAAGLMGRSLSGRVPGIDFASGLAGALARDGRRLFLLGAKPGVARQAAENLKKDCPGLEICGVHDGYFTESAPVAEAIRLSGADVVFVCLGAPKQEKWIAEHGPSTGAHLLVGLGGTLDVFAGRVKRAPVLWQRAGLEWLYRLIRQPSRLGRAARLPLFLCSAAAERVKGGRRR